MLSGNMLELIRDLPKELKRHFYATNLDTKTHGRLDQVNRQFRQFGSDVEIWKMRIRKLLPGIYMPEKQSLLDYIIFYRTIVAIQEFKAFSLQILIYDFFPRENAEPPMHDAGQVQHGVFITPPVVNDLNNLFTDIIEGKWRPLNSDELDDLARKSNADEANYLALRNAVKMISAGLDIMSSKDSGPETKDANNNEELTKEQQIQILDIACSSGDRKPSYLYSLNKEATTDSDSKNKLTESIALAKIIYFAPAILFARNHEPYIIAWLMYMHNLHPTILDHKLPLSDGPEILGEQLFMMALGSRRPSCAIQLLHFPCVPAVQVVEWLASVNANCLKASHIDKLHFNQALDWDKARLFYNPLYLTIEAIVHVYLASLQPEDVIRHLTKFEYIAKKLIDNGALWNEVAKIDRNGSQETPADLAKSILTEFPLNEEINHSKKLHEVLQGLLAYQPQNNISVKAFCH